MAVEVRARQVEAIADGPADAHGRGRDVEVLLLLASENDWSVEHRRVDAGGVRTGPRS
jgi:hypothetical protein